MIPKYIIIHHSALSKAEHPKQFEITNNAHKARGFPKSTLGFYVGYHYVIEGNGEVKQSRQENEIGSHCQAGGMNMKSIGICIDGNFENEKPSVEQMISLQKLVRNLVERHRIPRENIKRHGEIGKTACCGKNLLPLGVDHLTWIDEQVDVPTVEVKKDLSLVSNWALETKQYAVDRGVMVNWGNAQGQITPKKIAYIFYNLGWLSLHPDDEKSPYKNGEMTEEQFLHALHKGKVF